MDLKQLEYFVRVAELGSFTRAAGVLNIAQPALSRQVRLLEVELRQNLLLRNGRGVTVTEAGKLLLEHGRGILHQVERAREDLSRLLSPGGALAGHVALGMPPSIARILTVPLTRVFRQRLPNAALSISEGLTISMQEGLQTGRLDLALLYNPAPNPDFEISPLLDEPLLLIGPKKGRQAAAPITLREVSSLPLVIPSRPNALRMLAEAEMLAIGCKPMIELEIDGVAAILDLVADGAGHAILPRHSITAVSNADAYLVRPITNPPLVSRLALATAARRTMTMTQQAMIDLVREVTAEILSPPAE